MTARPAEQINAEGREAFVDRYLNDDQSGRARQIIEGFNSASHAEQTHVRVPVEVLNAAALKIEHYAAEREDRGQNTDDEAMLLAMLRAATAKEEGNGKV